MGAGHGFVGTVITAVVVVAAFSVLLSKASSVKTLSGGVNQSITSIEQTFSKGG